MRRRSIHRRPGRTAGAVWLGAAVLLAATALADEGEAAPEKHVYRRVGDTELAVHLFRPTEAGGGSRQSDASAARRAAVLVFHGGGWTLGEASWGFARARRFATLGAVGMAVEYRLADRRQTTPLEAMADAREAFRWVRAHAADLGVDPGRVAGYGWSAGGHLVASAALFATDGDGGEVASRPDAMILVSPAIAVENDAHFVELLLDRVRADELSPAGHVRAGMPPTLILQGESDTVTPTAGVRRFCEAMVEHGNDCELHVFPEVGHLFTPSDQPDDGWPAPDPEVSAEAGKLAEAFLRRLGYLPDAAGEAPAAAEEEAADPELEQVKGLLEQAREEIREFREAGGEEEDPEHPGRKWAAELWRFREEHPGTPAADRATTESVHFMLHAGQAEEAVERALALPLDDGAWSSLHGILFEAAELLGEWGGFLDTTRSLLAAEEDPGARARLRFRLAQALWVADDLAAAREELAALREQAPDDDWAKRATAAGEELRHPEMARLPAEQRQGRDLWQRPGRTLDELGVRPGERVADVGAGGGYFSFLLAHRVGPEGKVYGVDIAEPALERLAERAAELGLTQIETVLGSDDDPRLPAGELDAVLVVDTYHEMREHAAMMAAMARGLRPGGRLAIADTPDELGHERTAYHDRHKIPVELVVAEAAEAGLRLEKFLSDFAGHAGSRRYYLAVFAKPDADDG